MRYDWYVYHHVTPMTSTSAKSCEALVMIVPENWKVSTAETGYIYTQPTAEKNH